MTDEVHTSYPTVKTPTVTKLELTTNPKHRLLMWDCPFCDGLSGAFINLGSTGKSVECSSCGATFWATIKWVHSSPTTARETE